MARIAESFLLGLWIGSLSLAVLGVTWTVMRRADAGSATPVEPALSQSWIPMLLTGIAIGLPVAFLTLAGDFFDDFNAIGHRSLIAQFQHDQFPPRHQIFPDYPFRYHYGFNVVAAALTGLFRLSVPAAIDLLVILGFIASWCLAWRLGERMTRSKTGLWTALGGLVGGGAFHFFLWYSDWATQGAIGVVVGGNRINFPVVMYFFQKPFALGIPLTIGVMLAASFRPRPEQWWGRIWVLALLLASLSLVQEALLVTLLPCLVVHELLRERHLRAMAAPLVALALAVPTGGVLFSSMPGEHLGLVQFRFWPGQGDPLGVLIWYLLTTGVLIPLGLVGLWAAPRLRWFLLLLIAGSFAVPLFFVNPYAWDIVKLATIGQLAAGLAAGSALAWLAESRRRLRVPVLIVLSVLLFASPVGYVGHWIREMVRPTREIGEKLRLQRNVRNVPEWSRIIAWIRERNPVEGSVYCDNQLLNRQMLLAGVNTAGPPRHVDQEFGIPRERIERRRAHLEQLPDEAQAWLDEGIFWVVIDPDCSMADTVARWVEAGQAQVATTEGSWTLYRMTRPEKEVPRRGIRIGGITSRSPP